MNTGFIIEAKDRYIDISITLSGSFQGRKQAADYLDLIVRALQDSGSSCDRKIKGSVSIDDRVFLTVISTESDNWTRDLQDGLPSLLEDDLVTLKKFVKMVDRENQYLDEMIERAIIEELAFTE